MGKIRGGCGPSMSLRLCLVSIDCGVVVLRCIGALLAGKRDFARAVQSVSAGASRTTPSSCSALNDKSSDWSDLGSAQIDADRWLFQSCNFTSSE